MSKEKNEDIWVICPECKTKLKKENISDHLKHVHDKKVEDMGESSIKVLPKKERKKKPSGDKYLGIIPIVFIIAAIAVAAFFILPAPSDDSDNRFSNNPGWLNDYEPLYSVGNASDNFWTDFPVDGPYAGQTVQHLTWITEDLKEKPVVFVCHRTGCQPCTPQADRVKALMETYGGGVVFYDLDNPFSGYGVATEDTLEKFNDAFYYDANGPPSYIAFTGVFTLIKNGGEVKIGWHSWEGNVVDAEMESWIKDTIYYYSVNK